jgi:hypothetical protein
VSVYRRRISVVLRFVFVRAGGGKKTDKAEGEYHCQRRDFFEDLHNDLESFLSFSLFKTRL